MSVRTKRRYIATVSTVITTHTFFVLFTDLVNPSRPASACSMVSALIVDQGQQCPVCHCRYDSGKQRKLVDTNCGHARCFKCMFAVELCPLCHRETQIGPKHQSSRESGFQSFNGSVSSVYSMNTRMGAQIPSTMQMQTEEDVDFDRQSSTGSLLSLVSAQSALNMMAVPQAPSIASSRLSYYEPPNFSRVDQKRHSLSSLSRYQPPQAASISSRNSYFRRSAVISRSSRRMMSSIIEHQRKSIYHLFFTQPHKDKIHNLFKNLKKILNFHKTMIHHF